MTIREHIDQIIAEEYSINDNVLSLTREISNKIEVLARNNTKTAEEIEPGLRLARFSIDIDLFDKTKTSIYVNNYYFKDKSVFDRLYEKYKDVMNEATSAFIGRRCIINVNSCTISGGLVKHIVNDSIQHEIEHCFQEINAGCELPRDNNYTVAYSVLVGRAGLVDRLTIEISKAFYYSYSFEQDGFVNGLYQYLEDCDRMLTWNDIEGSSAMEAYKNFVEALKIVFADSNKEDAAEILRERFHFGYCAFKNRCAIAKKRFATKIGKVLAKHRKDMIEKGYRLNENVSCNKIRFGFY